MLLARPALLEAFMSTPKIETEHRTGSQRGNSNPGPRCGSDQGHLLCLFRPAIYYAGNLSDKLSIAKVQKPGQAR